jgi:hypothetical protein
LPPSRCSDNRTALVYYIGPSCTNGTCSWAQQEVACPCYNGGCVGTGTASGTPTTSVPLGVGGLTTAKRGRVGGLGGLSARGFGDLDEQRAIASRRAALNACERAPSAVYCDSNTSLFARQATCTAISARSPPKK